MNSMGDYSYPGGYRDQIAQTMMLMQQQPQQRPQGGFMPGIPTRRPAMMPGGIAPMGGMTPQGGGQVGNPGTQDFDRSFNAAGGNYQPYPTSPGNRLGGSLGMGGTFDPSMWNSDLPTGSLTGGY